MATHSAVLIVDVQKAFSPPAKFVHRLARYARRFPCRIFTRYINPPGSQFRRLLREQSCPPGSEESELVIPPSKGDIVLNKIATYGLSPAHLRTLKKRGVKNVTVCGMDTDACVLGVMFSLFDVGIECHLKENLCWSSSGLHRAALAIIRAQFPAPR